MYATDQRQDPSICLLQHYRLCCNRSIQFSTCLEFFVGDKKLFKISTWQSFNEQGRIFFVRCCDDHLVDNNEHFCRHFIPQSLWNGDSFLFFSLEIYQWFFVDSLRKLCWYSLTESGPILSSSLKLFLVLLLLCILPSFSWATEKH